ncbi:hypothetical protein [Endozoicomonas sp. YOMI1]|uniref:hypothetical protein n=1 Tax=Endozoicomonas sp. YOMI1 TaxID=2828739 RepID=UPI0021484D6E|nr:hypothetical protein [Endozoicomonas sp. YOMI1]
MMNENSQELTKYRDTLLYTATLMNSILANIATGETSLARADALRGVEEIFTVLADDDHSDELHTPATTRREQEAA